MHLFPQVKQPFPFGIPAPGCHGRPVNEMHVRAPFLLSLRLQKFTHSFYVFFAVVEACVPWIDGLVFHEFLVLFIIWAQVGLLRGEIYFRPVLGLRLTAEVCGHFLGLLFSDLLHFRHYVIEHYYPLSLKKKIKQKASLSKVQMLEHNLPRDRPLPLRKLKLIINWYLLLLRPLFFLLLLRINDSLDYELSMFVIGFLFFHVFFYAEEFLHLLTVDWVSSLILDYKVFQEFVGWACKLAYHCFGQLQLVCVLGSRLSFYYFCLAIHDAAVSSFHLLFLPCQHLILWQIGNGAQRSPGCHRIEIITDQPRNRNPSIRIFSRGGSLALPFRKQLQIPLSQLDQPFREIPIIAKPMMNFLNCINNPIYLSARSRRQNNDYWAGWHRRQTNQDPLLRAHCTAVCQPGCGSHHAELYSFCLRQGRVVLLSTIYFIRLWEQIYFQVSDRGVGAGGLGKLEDRVKLSSARVRARLGFARDWVAVRVGEFNQSLNRGNGSTSVMAREIKLYDFLILNCRVLSIIIQAKGKPMLRPNFPCRLLGLLTRPNLYQVSKMANYASQPKHTSTADMWSYGQGKTPSQLKLATWNVNGLRSVLKKGELQQYLKSSDPDIICLNEIKMDRDAFLKQKNSISEQIHSVIKSVGDANAGSWFWYWNFCKVSSGYSGILTLSKHKPITAFEQFPLDHHMSLQGRCLTLEFQKFFLVNCYKPNSGSTLQRLEERTQIYERKLTQFIKQLSKKKTVIICGDMNVAHNEIDLARPKANTRSPGFTKEQREAFNHFLSETGLIDGYRHLHPDKVEYTWWSTRARARETNVGWRIDYILMTDAKILRSVDIRGGVMGSDHCPVECTVQM